MTEGWKCPNCGKAHAPFVETCPEQGIYASGIPAIKPWEPAIGLTGDPLPPRFVTTC